MANIIMLFFLMFVFPQAGCSSRQAGDQVCFKDYCFNVEIADNNIDRMRGLQLRESLPDNMGMLFIFPESRIYSFWMKDTLIPLDIIWIDYDRRIVHIEHNVEPCRSPLKCPSYTPPKKALYVLEINAGKAEELGMLEGMSLDIVKKQE